MDGEEIEEDELHIASLEADADEDFGGEEVGDPEFEEEFHDNRTGEYLDPELVAKARSEEVEFMAKIGLYQEVDIAECLEITGRPPISTRWVDVNKGSMESPNVRCRLVARDFKPKGEKDRSDIFAAMPPLEAKKLLFRKAVGGRKELRNGEWCQQKIMLIDVKKAHLYGELEDHESAFVLPPDGECEQGKCWRLRRWLYGMRPAASAWEKHYSKTLVDMGFAKGVTAATVFYDKARDIRCVVHGDDFTLLGWEEDLHDVRDGLKAKYELKVRGVLGGAWGDQREVTILNRRLRWEDDEITYEADPEHVRKLVEGIGLLADSNGLEKPAVKEAVEDVGDPHWNEELDPGDARLFRALAARANYLSQDRADIQYAAKEACRHMAAPTRAAWGKLKRLVRYLLQFPRLSWTFKRDECETDTIDVFSDSDWAGCVRTRRSTSGGVVTIGGSAIKHWSLTQATVALSSGEAEYLALVKAACEGIGIQALARDLGWEMRLIIHVDSSTARSIANRSGVGKLRHIETRVLWVQQAVRECRFALCRVAGKDNPADILTKPMSLDEMRGKLRGIGAIVHARGEPERRRWADYSLP